MMGVYTPETEEVFEAMEEGSYIDNNAMRRWFAEVAREEREAERKGIMDLILEMHRAAIGCDDAEGIWGVYEALVERNDK